MKRLDIRSSLRRAPAHSRPKHDGTNLANGAPKVVFVTQWYAPEPTSVPVLTAKQLQGAGMSVRVLTGVPNLPDGRVYDGYRAWMPRRETHEGIGLLRAPLYPNHSTSALKRMANYLSWALSASVIGLPQLRRADVSVVHCTPATAALPALVGKLLFHTPYLVIVQDLWPDTVTASGFMKSSPTTQLITGWLNALVKQWYGRADRVVVISPGMGELLKERGVDPRRLRLVYNSVDEEVYRPEPRDGSARAELGVDGGSFLIVYAGNQGSAQDLATLVRAVGSLDVGRPVDLVLVGWGVERESLEDLASSTAPGRVHFVDRLPPSGVRRIQNAADLCVVSLRDDPLFRITVPSKLQALLASGLPILGIVAGDAAQIIDGSGAGFVAKPGDADSVSDAIGRAAEMDPNALRALGERGHTFYASQMSSGRRSDLLSQIVSEMLAENLRRSPQEPGVANSQDTSIMKEG